MDVAIGVLERDGKVMVSLRRPPSDFPWLWEFGGGKIDANEKPKEAVIREFKEEYGIETEIEAFVGKEKVPDSDRVLHIFLLKLVKGSPCPIVAEEIRWVTLDEAEKLPGIPVVYQIVIDAVRAYKQAHTDKTVGQPDYSRLYDWRKETRHERARTQDNFQRHIEGTETIVYDLQPPHPQIEGYTFLGEGEFCCDNPEGPITFYDGSKAYCHQIPVYRNELFREALGLREDETHPACEFVLIPAGQFMMGGDLYEVEQPKHLVTIKNPFLLARTELTQAVYEAITGTNPSRFIGSLNPVENISWDDAVEFCNHTLDLRLPSEAEWEYACRAGSRTNYYFGNSAVLLADYAWYSANYSDQPQQVAEKLENAFGLFDMHGNVLELVQDGWQSDYVGAPDDGSAWEPGASSYRVLRGGCWADYARICRSAYRGRYYPGLRNSYLGFRPARSLDLNPSYNLTVGKQKKTFSFPKIVGQPDYSPLHEWRKETKRDRLLSRDNFQRHLEGTETIIYDLQAPHPQIEGYTYLGVGEFCCENPEGPVQLYDGESAYCHRIPVYRNELFREALGLGEDETHPACEFVLIPPGQFMMGGEVYEDEQSIHPVNIKHPFLLARTELTQAVYEAITGTNPSHFIGSLNPVENISWDDAVEFCNHTLDLRLPSEAEWEYACRARSQTQYYFGNDEYLLVNYGWYGKNSKQTHPVAEKLENAFGLFDMHGNVWEWCQDNWHSNYDGAPSDGSAWETGASSRRVLRGGGWRNLAWNCRSAFRSYWGPDYRGRSLGFRPARSLDLNPSYDLTVGKQKKTFSFPKVVGQPEGFREFREGLERGQRRVINPTEYEEMLHPHRNRFPEVLVPQDNRSTYDSEGRLLPFAEDFTLSELTTCVWKAYEMVKPYLLQIVATIYPQGSVFRSYSMPEFLEALETQYLEQQQLLPRRTGNNPVLVILDDPNLVQDVLVEDVIADLLIFLQQFEELEVSDRFYDTEISALLKDTNNYSVLADLYFSNCRILISELIAIAASIISGNTDLQSPELINASNRLYPIWMNRCAAALPTHQDIKTVGQQVDFELEGMTTQTLPETFILKELAQLLGSAVYYLDETVIQFTIDGTPMQVSLFEIDEVPLAELVIEESGRTFVQSFVYPSTEIIMETIDG